MGKGFKQKQKIAVKIIEILTAEKCSTKDGMQILEIVADLIKKSSEQSLISFVDDLQ